MTGEEISDDAEERDGQPTTQVYRSADGKRWVVHVDTDTSTGRVTVYINDSPAVFDADPEAGEDD